LANYLKAIKPYLKACGSPIRGIGRSNIPSFGCHWIPSDIKTGTPTFLVKILTKRFEYRLEEKEVSDSILSHFVLEQQEHLDIDSLLLQTGYLTIKEILQESPTEERTFILKHPNHEVKQAFNRFLKPIKRIAEHKVEML
jgi:23S rRNA A2030 N6-methylase RlmJ